MRKCLLASVALIGFASQAQAVPLTLTGDFIRVGISDAGTFGSNGNIQPGFQHDATGTGTFDPNRDYVSPGTPHDGFSINSTQTGFRNGSNTIVAFSDFGTASPTAAVVPGFSLAATWTGGIAGFIQITNTYFFNPGDERVNVETTLTALTNLTNLNFARSVDPDPDNSPPHDEPATKNTRGNGTLAPADVVSSRGAVTDLFLAILNLTGNTFVHNTRIGPLCCSNIEPESVLLGAGATFPVVSTADESMNMAWAIGTLNAGQSVTIRYAYVVGDNIGGIVVDPGDPPSIPAPATIALFGAALLGLGNARRRRTN